MVVSELGYGELLDLVYESAVDPETWPVMLDRLADSVGAASAALIDQNQQTRQGAGMVVRLDPAVVQPYFQHYAPLNPLLDVKNLQARLKSWTPEIFTDEEQLPKATLLRSEYYNDFLRPLDIHSILSIGLHLRDLNGVLINLMRPARMEQFGHAETEVLHRIHPHLIRAYHLTVRLAGLRQLAGDLSEALERSPYGLAIVAGDARIRRMNGLAERLACGPNGLTVQGGRLAAVRSEDGRRLQALIAAAACSDATDRGGGSLAITGPGRRLPLALMVAPLPSRRSPIFDEGLSALVCITDLEAGVSLPEQRLLQLFGLTRAESKVALALLEGGGARQAAESLGISFNTVRVHLVHIYEKTGTGRQSELVRLMMRAVGADFGG